MDKIEYILCHGSGNRFVLLDAVAQQLTEFQTPEMVQKICHENNSDGVLFLTEHHSGYYAMRMFNTDGSQAEMCGNGIRCVARLLRERYLKCDTFTMVSGEKFYDIAYEAPIAKGVETYGVMIQVSTLSPDFLLASDRFVGKSIEALDHTSYFTFLNLGNPHIVTMCDEIDLERLSAMGERVKKLQMIFPNGVNVSLMMPMERGKIFVATYERGVGLTPSCGTAMTASCTAATLLGVCRDGVPVEVRNRGGVVFCTTTLDDGIITKLMGNATFDSVGTFDKEGNILELQPCSAERDAWSDFIKTLE